MTVTWTRKMAVTMESKRWNWQHSKVDWILEFRKREKTLAYILEIDFGVYT